MLRFTEELIARVNRAGAAGTKLLRADSGFWSNKVFARLEKAGWQYSIGVRMQKGIRRAVEMIDEELWQPIPDYPGLSDEVCVVGVTDSACVRGRDRRVAVGVAAILARARPGKDPHHHAGDDREDQWAAWPPPGGSRRRSGA
jgi:hypothetical protein